MTRWRTKLTDEDCQKIMRLIRDGHQLKDLAKQYGVHYSVISRRCKDQLLARRVPIEKINKVIKAIKSGCTKAEAAHKYGLSIGVVDSLTKYLKGYPRQGNHIIRPSGIALLNRLLVDGYLVADYDDFTAKSIKLHFPAILEAQYEGRKFYYLKGREDETIEAFFKQSDSCLISFVTLEKISFLLGVETTKPRTRSTESKSAKKKDHETTSRRFQQPFLEDFT